MSKGAPTIFVPTPKRALLLFAILAVCSITLLSLRQQPFSGFSRPQWLQQYDGTVAEQIEQCRALLRHEAVEKALSSGSDDPTEPTAMPTENSVPIAVDSSHVDPVVHPAPEDLDMAGTDEDDDEDEVSSDPAHHFHGQFHNKPQSNADMPLVQSATADAPVEGSCNPFARPGFIYPDGQNTWVPTLPGCEALPLSRRDELMEHLRNKRFFFYGDSISRFAARDMCTMLGATWTNFHHTPKEYYFAAQNQALHSCNIPQLNFTIVNVYTFGLEKWDMPEFPFLSQHISIRNDTFIHPSKWQFEHRLRSTFEVLNQIFGQADFVFVNSGLWDLYYLQKYMVDPQRSIPETAEPHWSYLQNYVGRITEVLGTIRSMQTKPNRKIFWLALHDPAIWERDPDYCMAGYPQEMIDRVHISCHTPARIRALRETQLAVVEEERRQGRRDIEWLPYHRWVRAVDEDKRMRDDIHPSAYTNQLLVMEILWESREADRRAGVTKQY